MDDSSEILDSQDLPIPYGTARHTPAVQTPSPTQHLVGSGSLKIDARPLWSHQKSSEYCSLTSLGVSENGGWIGWPFWIFFYDEPVDFISYW